MHSPRRLTSICIVIAVVLCAPQFSLGQYSISSIAGGGPNNLAALSASIGFRRERSPSIPQAMPTLRTPMFMRIRSSRFPRRAP